MEIFAQIVSADRPIEPTCRIVGVSVSGFYVWTHCKPSARSVRHEMVPADASGPRRVPPDLRRKACARRARARTEHGRGALHGRARDGPSRPRWSSGPTEVSEDIPNTPTASDLVNRDFARTEPNRLWLTDITELPTREDKAYCAVVLDAFSRRVVGWSIDPSQTGSFFVNALGMAIENRQDEGVVIHCDHGTPYTSWAFTKRAIDFGLAQSMGSIGDCYDKSQMESFGARMQVELLNRQRWSTRLELANAMFEYLEIFHNWQRRHSSLGMLSPIEYERRHADNPARDRASCRRDTQGTREQSPIPGRFKSIRYRL